MNIDLKKINWKQPKYVLPAILFPLLLGLGWLVIDLFNTGKAEGPSNLETTEYLNPALPSAQLKDDGIGGKYDNMARSWGKIQDYSAVETIEQNEADQTEFFNSRYTEEDLAMLEAAADEQTRLEMERLRAMQSQLERSAQAGEEMMYGDDDDEYSDNGYMDDAYRRQQQTIDELRNEIAQLLANSYRDTYDRFNSYQVEETDDDNSDEDNGVDALDDETEASRVVKKFVPSSGYFNTIVENDPEPNLIKAIIDEDIKAVEGSRVRLRLLDDVEIDGTVVEKGSYIYATMSGFGQQRVKGSIQSMLINDELIKVNLSIFDTDGLEGLYIPNSSFRETAKDIASGAMSNSMSINNGTTDNSFTQWGIQSLQNATTKTFDAISKAIRKNKAKLKYGTFVYLVNARQTNK